jgi:hypothetical protein
MNSREELFKFAIDTIEKKFKPYDYQYGQKYEYTCKEYSIKIYRNYLHSQFEDYHTYISNSFIETDFWIEKINNDFYLADEKFKIYFI